MKVPLPAFVAITLMATQLAQAADVTLSADEAETLKLILKKDKLMQELTKSQTGLAALNRILKMTVSGPVTLAIQWNQADIATWRKANVRLVQIEKMAVCNDIALEIAGGTTNEHFFEELSKARGCDD